MYRQLCEHLVSNFILKSKFPINDSTAFVKCFHYIINVFLENPLFPFILTYLKNYS